MSLEIAIMIATLNGDTLAPHVSTSTKYKHWISVEDLKRCVIYAENHGKIWLISEMPNSSPPIHPNCRCAIKRMQTIKAGTATIKNTEGADWKLKYERMLPDYYITLKELKTLGWRKGKTISNVITGKLLTKGIYQNKNGHLPHIPGRIWYEADINYTSGKRNSQRVLWSNDGLIFVTYDHYETFYEIS